MKTERGFWMGVMCTDSPRRVRLFLLLALVGCGGAGAPSASRSGTSGPLGSGVRATRHAPATKDPLGPRPETPPPPLFSPPVPVVYTRPSGMRVWLLERHALPLVSVQLVVPAGSREDPAEASGLAWATANMLDEGAGKRTSIAIAEDLDRLGATLATGALADYAFADLTSLKANLGPALSIFGDVLAKPTFAANDWARVHTLWQNDLRARQSDPQAVARIVAAKKLFPKGHPYAHPVTGTLASSSKVSLPMARAFHASHWRPEKATLVVVGDVTREELDPLLDAAVGAWKPRPEGAKMPASAPPAPWSQPTGPLRVVLVDRPDAPQSVISIVRQGIAATNPDAAGLVRVNGALGGSFTSRLNQDLREEHGWSYGAHSRFSFTTDVGMFSAQAAVQTAHTAEALRAALGDITQLATSGLTTDELSRTQLLARGDLVEAYEGVSSAVGRLGRNAGIGLPETGELQMAQRTYAASKDALDALAAKYLDVRSAIAVVVGPKATIEPALRSAGMTNIETSGPEGD